MASRRGDTFDKRQRERRRQEKAADKRSRRQGTPAPNGPLVATQERPRNDLDTMIEDFKPTTTAHRELLEKFGMIKEHRKAGGIDNDTFELLRMEIFEELGLEP